MTIPGSFTVSHSILTLAVTAVGDRVTRIKLNATGDHAPQTGFEQRVATELGEYFAGERIDFTIPIAPHGTPFQLRVWSELQSIPYGETRSYGQVANDIGRPGASRAVGSANNANPLPIVIPCHRVVGSGGSIGGFSEGVELKLRLLAIEARRLIDLPPERGYLSPVQ